MLFCHNFIFFMRLRLGSQLVVFIYVVLSDNLLIETTNLIQQIKRWKSHIQATCHKVILDSKAFAFSSD